MRHPAHRCINEHWYDFDFLGLFTVTGEQVFTGYYYWALQGYCLAVGASHDRPLKLTFTDKEIVLT